MSKQPSFAHLVVYHARPEHVDAVVASMREAAGAAAALPDSCTSGRGGTRTPVPSSPCPCGNEEAFSVAMPAVFAAIEDHDPQGEWDAAPPEVFRLVPARAN